MSKINRDLANVAHQAERDQDRAEIAEMAGDIGQFYRGLLAESIPPDVAGSLTQAFAAMVVFADGCDCEVGG